MGVRVEDVPPLIGQMYLLACQQSQAVHADDSVEDLTSLFYTVFDFMEVLLPLLRLVELAAVCLDQCLYAFGATFTQ